MQHIIGGLLLRKMFLIVYLASFALDLSKMERAVGDAALELMSVSNAVARPCPGGGEPNGLIRWNQTFYFMGNCESIPVNCCI